MSEKIRYKTRDISYTYRMDAGFPGDVNRTHPASISPEPIDTTNPPTLYGAPMLLDATSHNVRRFIAGDASATAVNAFGVSVRPYPFQAASGTNYGAIGVGAGTPPTSGVIDALRAGYIMGYLAAPTGVAVKGGTVYVWCAASTGAHVQGGLEDVASVGNTVPLANAVFNGSPDAKGNVEISFNV